MKNGCATTVCVRADPTENAQIFQNDKKVDILEDFKLHKDLITLSEAHRTFFLYIIYYTY